ncbi:MAG: cccA [Candidatus Brocadiaceae bacterium]|nr:cccA [Candidatus Brocadiaceae bacterium]
MRGVLSFVAVSVIFSIFSGVLHAQKLDKGVGPYAEFWKPIPTQRYWAPDYFYSPPAEPKGVFNADECTICHKALNPGLVKAWAESSHANLDKLTTRLSEREIRRDRKKPRKEAYEGGLH